MIIKVRNGSCAQYVRFINLKIGFYELTTWSDKATVFKSKSEAGYYARLWVKEDTDVVPSSGG